MAQYNLHRTGRSSRRVEIKKSGTGFQPVPLLIAFLIAFFVWLYMDGQSIRQELAEAETVKTSVASAATVTTVTTVVSADPAPTASGEIYAV